MELAVLENIAKVGTEPKGRKAVRHPLRGIAASQGVAIGRCIVVKGIEDLDRLEDGAIAVSETASPYLIPFIPRLAGLATERGGSLAPLLTYVREEGIPAVVGVKGLMEAVREGEMIWVDGEQGIVSSSNS